MLNIMSHSRKLKYTFTINNIVSTWKRPTSKW